MIEVIKGRIKWMDHCNNAPTLELLVSRIPKSEEHRYELRQGLYFSEVEGFCSFFSWDGTPDRGYGGRSFHITMKDGTETDLVGPWSSSSSAVSSVGFGPCADVNITDEPGAYERGYTFYAGSVTMELLGRYRDIIEVTPYRYRVEEPWAISSRGFSHRLVWPKGTKFTMLQTDPTYSKHVGTVSGQQAEALGYMPRFVPIVELPDGSHWLKPRSFHEPMRVPEGVEVQELRQDAPKLGESMLIGRTP